MFKVKIISANLLASSPFFLYGIMMIIFAIKSDSNQDVDHEFDSNIYESTMTGFVLYVVGVLVPTFALLGTLVFGHIRS